MASRLLLINPCSGKSQFIEQHREQFSNESTKVVELTSATDLSAEVALATDEGCETVIAAGGDGTVNAAVNALMMIETARRPKLAIIPLGTANDFAGTLQIPNNIDSVVRSLEQGRYEWIDVAQIKAAGFEQYYANIAAGGNSVRVSEQLTDELKENWGAFCYIRGSISALGNMETYHIVADLDGERIEVDSWGVLVANGRTTAGHIAVAPLASPSDGLIDVIIIRDGTVVDMVEIVSKTLLSSFLESEQVIFRQVKQLQLHSVPGMRFTLDGEVIDEEPVNFCIVPRAIRMFVGDDYALSEEASRKRVLSVSATA